MEPDLLEIIELPDGEVALRRVDDDGQPLVRISFSAESELLLNTMKMAVASAMIEAGMHAYAELNAMPDEEENTGILH